MADWDALQREIWRLIRRQDASLERTAAQVAEQVVAAVRAAGQQVDAATAKIVEEYVTGAENMIRAGIEAAVGPVAGAVLPQSFRSEFMAGRIADAYARRWPDGLRLSDRVWTWQDATRRGVSDVVARGVRAGESASNLIYRMQREIERQGSRFEIATRQVDDWAADLARAGRQALQNPKTYKLWLQSMEATRRHIDTLTEGGTRRQAEETFRQIRRAVLDGRAEAIDEALQWWVYDRQLYSLKRIARTEMSTAHHRAGIAASIEDGDVIGYRWRLSGSHPEWDICDLYAGVELGLGRGVYPKDKVPAGKAHPHCMCSLTPVTRPRKDRGEVDPDRLVEFAGPKRPIELYTGGSLGAGGKTVGGGSKPTWPPPSLSPKKPQSADPGGAWPTLTDADLVDLDKVKALGAGRLDDVLDTPLKGGLVRDLVAGALEPLTDAMPELRRGLDMEINKRQGTGQIAPATHNKGGKGKAILERAAGKYPDAWVDQANAVKVRVTASKQRGAYWRKKWNSQQAKFEASIRTSDSSTAEHEYGHHLQAMMPKLDAVFQAEHRRRTAGDAVEVLYGWAPSETGRPDKYVSRYQGREYAGHDALEVLTMAFQAVLGDDARANRMLAEMLQSDQEMLRLTLGVLFHYKPT